MPVWLIPLIVSLVINVAAILITPKPKEPKPAAVTDAEYPTAEAGKPRPVLFGTVTMKSPNILHYSQKTTETYQIKV